MDRSGTLADKAAAPVPSPPLGWGRSQPEKQLVPTLPLPPAAPPGQQRTVVLSWGSNTAGQLGLCVHAPSNRRVASSARS